MRALALAVVGALFVAGCGDDGGQGATPTSTTSGTATVGPGDGNDTSVALLAPPAWSIGTSWTWQVRSGALTDGPVTVTTMVLGVDGAYDIGIADLAQATSTYPFHLVPLGAVDPACLCWEAHDTSVQLLRFPLTHGDTFTNDFWSAPGAQVTVAATNVSGPDGVEPGYQSNVSYPGGGLYLQAEYVPRLGQFVRVASYFGDAEPFAEALLASIGTASTGIGFRATDLARFQASPADPPSLAPRPLSFPGGTVLFACFLPGDQGLYFAQLAGPGTPAACGGGSSGSTVLAAIATEMQAGPGSVSVTAGGQGSTTVEVFAVDTDP